MNILAIDLAWSGKTGWVLWGEGLKKNTPLAMNAEGKYIPLDQSKSEDLAGFLGHNISPIIAYGEFQVHKKAVEDRVAGIYEKVFDLIHKLNDTPFTLAYERTDWHQALEGANYKQKYAQERRVQRCLGRAEACLLLAAVHSGVDTYAIGAREAKQEFGAMRKDAVAQLLANEYPTQLEFRYDVGKNASLWDLQEQRCISHHVSDAMAIASVVSRRLRVTELGN